MIWRSSGGTREAIASGRGWCVDMGRPYRDPTREVTETFKKQSGFADPASMRTTFFAVAALTLALSPVLFTSPALAQGHVPHPSAHRHPPSMPVLEASGPNRRPVLRYQDYSVDFSLEESNEPRSFWPRRSIPNEGSRHDEFLRRSPCADVSQRSAIVAYQDPRVRRTLRAISCLIEPLVGAVFLSGPPNPSEDWGPEASNPDRRREMLYVDFYREFGENFDQTINMYARQPYEELMRDTVRYESVALDDGTRRNCPVMQADGLARLFSAVATTVLAQPSAYGHNRALGGNPRGTAWSAAQLACYRSASREPLSRFRSEDRVVPPPRVRSSNEGAPAGATPAERHPTESAH